MADFTRVGNGQVEPNQLSAQKTGQIYASLPLDTEVNKLQNGEFMFYDYANGTVNCGKDGSVAGTVATKITEPYLVFNEIKLYEPFWRTSYKDFAMYRVGDNYVTTELSVNGPVEGRYDDGALTVGVDPSVTHGTGTQADPYITLNGHTEYPYRMDGIAPRLFKTNIGDIYTTNMVKIGTGIEYAVGDVLVPVKNDSTKTLQLELKDTSSGSTQVAAGTEWQVIKVYTMPDGQPGLKLQRIA